MSDVSEVPILTDNQDGEIPRGPSSPRKDKKSKKRDKKQQDGRSRMFTKVNPAVQGEQEQ